MRRTALAATAAAAALIACAQTTALAATPTPTPPSTAGTAVNHTSEAKLDAYWTPQRLAKAKPLDAPAKAPSAKAPRSSDTAHGKPTLIPATKPSTKAVNSTAAASVWGTTGRLVFTVPGQGDYICTANVVTSNNHDVISTGRHCVIDIGTHRTFTNFRFAPGYDRGNAPHGWWNWRSMGWREDDTSPGGDNAFIVLSTGGNTGQHVQDVVGGSGIGFNWATNNYAHAIGIPGDKDYAVWCEGMPYDSNQGGVSLRNCNGLSGGASGGPFLVNYQNDGSAVQTGSYFGSWGDAYWAYYRDAAWQVFNGAQNA
ncbi:trypsin-like serine peptidase [Streptomyces sp. NPDC048718]|uniref:trypsin-like serine peptidase n=1 Tax=Streptomyces sp. NPDC048718 TaxID=3365587 RepID=UPI003712A001